MRYFFLLIAISLKMLAIGQAQFKEHYIEADRLASYGNYESAFALIASEAEQELDCHALGYYWNWCLLFGDKVNDSTFTFPILTKQVFGKAFIYTFKKEQMLRLVLSKCPTNGLLNKARGYQLYLEALLEKDLDIEERKMLGVVKHLRKALQGGVNDTVTNFYLGQGLEYQTKYGEAIRYYRRSYQLDDSHLQSLLKIAACFGKLSDWDSCLSYANTVLPIAETVWVRATAMRLKAEALAALNKRKSAKKLFKKVMQLTPNDYDNHLAYIEFLYPEKKKKACKEAAKLLRNNIFHRHIYYAFSFLFETSDREEIYNRVAGELDTNSKDLKWLQANRKQLK